MPNGKKGSTSKDKGITITFVFPEFEQPKDLCTTLSNWFETHHPQVTMHLKSTLLAQIKNDLNYDLGPFNVPKKNCL